MVAKVVTFKPSPPKAGRRAKRQSSLLQDALTTHSEDLLLHGRGGTDVRPVPPLADDAMKELRWKGQPKQGQAKRGGNPAIEKWELGNLGSWHPSGPDPNKAKDPTGKGVFSAFDPKGGAGRETGIALPGARDTWRPAHGRRADAPPAAGQPVWSPTRHAPEGLHALKGAERAPHPFNLTTEYRDALKEQPSLEERRKRESQLNALRVLRSKMQQSCRMHGYTINDVETMFQAMDTDGSGAIDYDEFSKGLRALDVVFGPKQLAALLEALDANGDGKVTLMEFLEQCDDSFRGEQGALGELDAEMHARLGTSAPKAAKKANMEAYGNTGGVFGMTMHLTLAANIALRNRHTKAGGASRFRLEATKLVQPVSPTAAAAIDRIYLFIKKEHLKVIDMFFRIDVDGSGEIEPVEFVQALSRMGLQLTREELDAVVRELDTDGDGTVELHEFIHQMKRISRARFTQTQTGGQTVARKRTGWLVGSEGVPWLQPPEFGHKIGMAGKVGRTQANTRAGLRSKFELQPKYFATQQERFRKAATATGQLRETRRQGMQRVGSQTARGPPLMLPPSALPRGVPNGSQSAR